MVTANYKKAFSHYICGLLGGVFVLCLAACGSNDDSSPGFRSTTCKHTLEAGSTTRCGYFSVPEDRNDPDNRETIQLYVAIYPSLSGNTRQPPVIYLTGGPGASMAPAYPAFESTDPANYIRHSFGDDRDVILLDQRGTNHSAPALYCSAELGPLRSQVYGIDYADAATLRIAALESCYDRLQRQEVDLSGYDSLENAADVRDLIVELGYDTVHLYGASYGTRLAMLTMDQYPQWIESVVIDSILPPEVNPFEREIPGIVYAFETFFDAAETAYPGLEAQFYEMMDDLTTTPVDVLGYHYDASGNPINSYTVSVSGDKLAGYLVAKLKETPYDADLPLEISDMYTSGDYGLVADAWISFIDFFFPTGEASSDAPSVGMYNSVFGADDAYYTNRWKIEQAIFDNVDSPSLATYLEVSFINMEPAIQGLWPVDALPFAVSDPVVSDIPTLMLVGELDTATPQIFSRPSADLLANSYYFTIPAGHATAYLPCVCEMISAFLDDPLVAPVNGCATGYVWN